MKSIVALLILASLTSAAPVPFTYHNNKSRQPNQLVGSWDIHWQGGIGRATFHSQGGFECIWCGQRWIGYWSVEDGILTVTEAVEPSSPSMLPNWYTWKASLDQDYRGGRLPTGGTFKLKLKA